MRPLARALVFILSAAAAGCIVATGHTGPWHCDTAADCESGEKCLGSGGYGVCAPADACTYDGDCANGRVCVDLHCKHPECTTSDTSACGSYACNSSKYACYRSCSLTGECAPTFACTNGGCEPATCTGTPFDCKSYTNESVCSYARGCSWSSAAPCRGTSGSCTTATTPLECAAQTGCSWVLPCSGTPAKCDTLQDNAACSSAQGCKWGS